jgi:ADP-heptose:LPS heptosyltransferase
MRKLIAGPWVGEFGWELYAWQAYIRNLSRNFDHTTIISRHASQALYADFCDTFVPHEPSGGLTDSFFMYNLDLRAELKKVITRASIPLTKETTLFLPRRLGYPPHTHYEESLQIGKYKITPEYINYGVKGTTQYDYIFHARARQIRPQDNWSMRSWNKLRDLLGDRRIACIGTSSEAALVEGTDDLRDLPLSDLVNLLHNAKCAFGPSSGPMHLASLCGLPHVVWSIPANKKRYETNWNPLKTSVLFDSSADWHPDASYIHNIFREWNYE